MADNIGTLGITLAMDSGDIQRGVNEANIHLARLEQTSNKTSKQFNQSAQSTRNWNQAIGQALVGGEDFLTVVGQTGLGGGLRAASNNFSQAARTLVGSGIAGAAAGVGVTLASVIIPQMYRWITATEEVESTFDRIKDKIQETADAQRDAVSHAADMAELGRTTNEKNVDSRIVQTREEIEKTNAEIAITEQQVEDLRNNIANMTQKGGNFLFDPDIANRFHRQLMKVTNGLSDIGDSKFADKLQNKIANVNEAFQNIKTGPLTEENFRTLDNTMGELEATIQQMGKDAETPVGSLKDLALINRNLLNMRESLDTFKESEDFQSVVESGSKLGETLEKDVNLLSQLEQKLDLLNKKKLEDIGKGKFHEQGSPIEGVNQDRIDKALESRVNLEEQIQQAQGAQREQLEQQAEALDKHINSLIETKEEAKERESIEKRINDLMLQGSDDAIQAAHKLTQSYMDTRDIIKELKQDLKDAGTVAEGKQILSQITELEKASIAQLQKQIDDLKADQKRSDPKLESEISIGKGQEVQANINAQAMEQLMEANRTDSDTAKQIKETNDILTEIRRILGQRNHGIVL